MPVVTFSKKYLSRLLSVKMTEKELIGHIGRFGCNVERSEGDEISIEVSPNRPDLFGAVGFARSLKNFIHRSKKLGYGLEDKEPIFTVGVGSEAGAIRPYIACLVALNLKLNEDALTDIINFTEKLCETYGRARKKIAIGIHDLDRIEPPLHYNAYLDEKYTPLGEKAERYFSDVVESTEKGKRYGYTIGSQAEGKLRYPALKDSRGAISLIPILNSERTRVTTKTSDVFVDITGMHEASINKISDLLAAMFMDMGAQIKRVEIAYPGKNLLTPSLEARQIRIPLGLAESEIGVEIGPSNMISLANKMGYEAALLGNGIRFSVPEYRLDVINEQDIVEDIAIAYGYDYIQPVPILSRMQGGLDPSETLLDSLSEAMVGMGFSEVMNSYLTNEESNFTEMSIADAKAYLAASGADYIRLKNAKAQTLTMMRTWALPSLLRNIALSRHEGMPQKLFELDFAFTLEKGIPREDRHLACVHADSGSNFNDMKAVVGAIAYFLGLAFGTAPKDHPSFIKGRCAKITLGKKEIGIFGELHPQVLNNLGIEEPASAMEINAEALVDAKA